MPTKPPDGEGDAKDEPKEEAQEVEPSTSAEVPGTDAGLTFLGMPIAAVLS